MDSVQVMLYEMERLKTTDPNGFWLMIISVSLLAFLALTIFGGFIFYLYKDAGKRKAD
ncbi:MAG: hypothetical protein JSS83_21935 [Cyanobacteria bacterium SZAS LIN-3]|nr:hypothetical protein [Cyanobacteria bacterium SZAS LIN-3]MBS2008556.1 hypothetical protein [Cyanobacteria bacterium SZAS TMP-1]